MQTWMKVNWGVANLMVKGWNRRKSDTSDVKDADNHVILNAKLNANLQHDIDTTANSGYQKLLAYQVHSGWESIFNHPEAACFVRLTTVVPSCQQQQN